MNVPLQRLSFTLALASLQRSEASEVIIVVPVVVAAVSSKRATVRECICGKSVELMLDSGSSVSLLKQEIVANTLAGQQEPGLRLISAAGVDIPILDHVKAEVTVGNLVKSHNFFVVKDLITSVILGTDFLQEHRLLLDFTTTPVTVVQSETQSQHIQQQADQPQAQEARSRLNTLWKAEQVFKIKSVVWQLLR